MHIFIWYVIIGFFIASAFAMWMADDPRGKSEKLYVKVIAFFFVWIMWPAVVIFSWVSR